MKYLMEVTKTPYPLQREISDIRIMEGLDVLYMSLVKKYLGKRFNKDIQEIKNGTRIR